MNVEYVNPFLTALLNVLSTMAMTDAVAGAPYLKDDTRARGDVTGMVGLAGKQIKGSLALTFSQAAALHIATQMLGEAFDTIDETVQDIIGEITNMVTGGAKKTLSEKGYKFELAIPTTITGTNHSISHKTNGPVVVVPFEIADIGGFFVEVCFEKV